MAYADLTEYLLRILPKFHFLAFLFVCSGKK